MTTEAEKEKQRDEAWEEYYRIRDQAFAEFVRIRDLALAECDRRLKEIEAME